MVTFSPTIANVLPLADMHQPNAEEVGALDELRSWAQRRLTERDQPLSGSTIAPDISGFSRTDLPAITPSGVGLTEAWHGLRDVLLPSAVPSDHPRYLAFVGGAPSVAAAVADMALSIGSVYGGSELEAGLVVRAEAEALRWLASLAGLPETARGTFLTGGSISNLSALVAARADRALRDGLPTTTPGVVLASANSHSSVTAATEIMGCELRIVGEVDHPLTGDDLEAALQATHADGSRVIAVSTVAGATNSGQLDDLARIATICRRASVWLHVDAAYGGAALLDKRHTDEFLGIELADSVVINPHKWLFTPYDCSALIYRDAEHARRTHAQRSPYLDVVDEGDNPADYAFHLSRRARGIPLWMSLVANGTDRYRAAVEQCVDLALATADRVSATDHLELLGTSLSVVVFARRDWDRTDYARWSTETVRTGLGLVTPTNYRGRPALRLCFVNPQTRVEDVERILSTLG